MDPEEIKEEKPKIGTIQLKNGKATLETDKGSVDFDINYVIGQCKQALRKSRPGFYTNKIREYLKELEAKGISAIPEVNKKLDALKAGKDINREFINQTVSYLKNIDMFKQVRTADPEKKEETDGHI